MSYILDALKKSEKQRPPGPVPDLFVVHGPQAPEPRRPWRAITAVLLLVAVAFALGVWTRSDPRDDSAVAAREASPATPAVAEPSALPARSVPVARDAAELPPDVSVAVKASGSRDSGVSAQLGQVGKPKAGEGGASTNHAPAGVSPVDGQALPATAPPAQPPDPSPPAAVSSALGTPAPSAVPATPAVTLSAPVPDAPVPAPAPPPPATPAPAAPVAVQEAAAPVPVPAVPEPEPPADGRVLDLSEVPPLVREGVSKILVSGHVWSEDPALRLLSVNDRLLHEGEYLSPGLKLQEITPGGAVFVVKGWHFKVDVGGP